MRIESIANMSVTVQLLTIKEASEWASKHMGNNSSIQVIYEELIECR